ncbi:MAG: CPXCG motif-containing cysteine-rich protein [Elusimicrobia bacterium]|nr:CPXCG motif-containing cysteine-rich protein [Elusimicrobiota bacterium]
MAKGKAERKTSKKTTKAKKPAARTPDDRANQKLQAEDRALNAKLESVITEVTKPEKTRTEQTASIECPYCGEVFEMHVSVDEEGQTLSEDCPVCSRSMTVHLQMEDEELQVEAYRS